MNRLLQPLAALSTALLLGSTACAQTCPGACPVEPLEPLDTAEVAAPREPLPVEVAQPAAPVELEAEPIEPIEVAGVSLPEPEVTTLPALPDAPDAPGALAAPVAQAEAAVHEEPVIEVPIESPALDGSPVEPQELPVVQEPIQVEPAELPVAPVVAAAPPAPREVEPGVPAPVIEQEIRDAPQGFDHSHATWNELLKQHVKGDNFNYGALKKAPEKLDAYLAELHAVTPEKLKGWSKHQRYAFWINVYNAHTIKIVVDNYPLKGIRSLDTGFGLNSVFDKEFINMQPHHPKGSKDKLSLNDVEHKILRERFKDARVHAAVNCASISCPPLLGEAFVAQRLDKQLNAQMKAFVNDSSRNSFDAKRGKVKASSIFKWFKEDFVRDAGSVSAYLDRYATPDRKELLKRAKISYLDYDWKLNDAK